MPARTFEDTAGTVWEVFEVHRSTHNAQAVSAGLEGGWLAFVSGSRKRRLAPFPRGWLTAETAELERLCQQARAANPLGLARAPGGRPEPDTGAAERRARVPQLRRRKEEADPVLVEVLPISATASSADPVEQTVRTFAQQARAHRLPAIEAMVQLKGLLARVYPSTSSEARDLRAVRRWFVDSFYFERETPPPEESDQSL